MKQTIESFIERVKVESNIHKFIQEDLIYKLITNFRKNYVKMNYPKKINNPLDIVLKFYKNYNKEFALFDAYFIISSGLNNKYRHPSGSVIKNLLLNNKHPQIVTEQQSSEAILKIDI